MFDQYPDAIPSLTVKPPVGDSYPAVVSVDGDIVCWNVTNSDLIYAGDGELQLTFTKDDVVVKSYVVKTRISLSIDPPAGTIPTPIENWIQLANEVIGETNQAAARAESAAEHQPYIGEDEYWYVWNGSEYVKYNKAIGDQGPQGIQGEPGEDGIDGYSPTVDTTQIDEGYKVVFSDQQGPHEITLLNGVDGQPGQDGISPSVTVNSITGGHRITIADASGTQSFDVEDGIDGERGPQGPQGEPGADSPVQDVQVNGTSVLQDGVANIPKAGSSALGVIRLATTYGIYRNNEDQLYIIPPTENEIKAGSHSYRPISPAKQHISAFYGLAKLAGADMAQSSNPVGEYTPEAQKAIRGMFGIHEELRLFRTITVAQDTPSIGFDTDEYGEGFKADEIMVFAFLPKRASGNLQVITYGIETTAIGQTSGKWVGQMSDAVGTGYSSIVISKIKRFNNNWRCEHKRFYTDATDLSGAINTRDGVTRYTLNGASWVRANNPLYTTSFSVCLTDGITAGSYFEFYIHDYKE